VHQQGGLKKLHRGTGLDHRLRSGLGKMAVAGHGEAQRNQTASNHLSLDREVVYPVADIFSQGVDRRESVSLLGQKLLQVGADLLLLILKVGKHLFLRPWKSPRYC